MPAEELCSTCGKKIRAGRAGSLTQWLFTEDSCQCAGKVSSLKLPTDDGLSSSEGSMICGHCGRLKGQSRHGSLTHWVFSAERCQCDFEKLKADNEGLFDDQEKQSTSNPYISDVHPALVDELENGPVEHHGLSPDRFPFERYRIIAEKGRGNSGIVYQCWDCNLKKRVAIKTLYWQHWTPGDLVRFQSEARSQSRFKHANVLQIFDFGSSESGQPYMVMEYVDGETLKEIIDRGGGVAPGDAISIFLQIVDGVKHAHQHGIFHRDLKSSNIMIGSGKTVKVIDFGIAALAHTQSVTLTPEKAAETLVGSPFYMSPDQLNGLKYDARSEIYSLGCVMFETLTGHVPYEGETSMATIAMHATHEIPELLDINGDRLDCPPAVQNIVKKSLAKQPADRFQNVDELQYSLAEAQTELNRPQATVTVDAPVEQSRQAKFYARYRTPAIACSVLAVLAVVGVGLYRAISLVPAPKPLPAESKIQLFDESRKQRKLLHSKADLFDDLAVDGMIVQYSPRESRLTIDATKNVDSILKRAVELKLPLRVLEVFNAEIGIDAFKLIPQFETLNEFCLSDVQGLDAEAWLTVGECKNLQCLRLSDVHATDDFLGSLLKLKSLRQLELDRSNFTVEGLERLAVLPINYLSFKAAPLTSAHINAIAKFPAVNALFVGDSGISDGDIGQISKITTIDTLGLNGLPVTDETLAQLARKLPRLSCIYIFRCTKLTLKGIERFYMLKPKCTLVNDNSDLKNSFAPSI